MGRKGKIITTGNPLKNQLQPETIGRLYLKTKARGNNLFWIFYYRTGTITPKQQHGNMTDDADDTDKHGFRIKKKHIYS